MRGLKASLLGQEAGVAAQGVVETTGFYRQFVADVGRRLHRFGWEGAGHALKALLHVQQVGRLGHQVGLSQRQAAARLFQVDPAAHARFSALADLLEGLLMQGVVLAGQQLHVAVALQVNIGLHGGKSGGVAGGQHVVEARQLVKAGLLDVVARAETVKNQLAQFHAVAGAAPVLRSDSWHVIAKLAADVALRIDLREECGSGDVLALQRGLEIVVLRLDFRVAEQRLFDDLVQCDHRLRRGLSRGRSRRLCKCSRNECQGKNRSRAFEQKRSHSDYSRVGLRLIGRHIVCKCHFLRVKIC
ncbi:hypothetical protein D3C86_1304490 [compost metagenome]